MRCPPTRVNLAQYSIYNRKIRDMSAKNRVIVIDTNKAFDTLPKSKSVIENSYMMTPDGGQVLGKAISEQVIIIVTSALKVEPLLRKVIKKMSLQ